MRECAKAESLFRMSLRVNPDNTIPLPESREHGRRAGKEAVTRFVAWRSSQAASRTAPRMRTHSASSRTARDNTTAPSGLSTACTRRDPIDMRVMALFVLVGAARGPWTIERVRAPLPRIAPRSPRNWAARRCRSPTRSPWRRYDAWLRNQPQRTVARLDAALLVHPLAASRSEIVRTRSWPTRMPSPAGRIARARCSLSSRRSRTPRCFEANSPTSTRPSGKSR